MFVFVFGGVCVLVTWSEMQEEHLELSVAGRKVKAAGKTSEAVRLRTRRRPPRRKQGEAEEHQKGKEIEERGGVLEEVIQKQTAESCGEG